MTLESGYLLNNRYRIETILGRGGMGAVYSAIDENVNIRVAVKENLFSAEEHERQFQREALLLAEVRHPNLPRVSDHFILPNQGQYLIMDYIHGEDLRSRLERGEIPDERQAVDWIVQICDALQYLHNHQPPILHRDIKPANIRIMPDGRAILVDFGLARTMEGRNTTIGAQASTPGFSPPEQYGTSRTDTRTDIYSIAATLYVLLTGELVEDGLDRVLGQKTLTPVRARNPKISAHVATAIEKGLERMPEDRYQVIEAFRKAITAVPLNEIQPPIALQPPVVAPKMPPYRNKWLIAGISTLILTVLLVAMDVPSSEEFWPTITSTSAATYAFTPTTTSTPTRTRGSVLLMETPTEKSSGETVPPVISPTNTWVNEPVDSLTLSTPEPTITFPEPTVAPPQPTVVPPEPIATQLPPTKPRHPSKTPKPADTAVPT